ncbi:MAG TPA: dihydropteroate synthase [Cytophagaceae bacterium]|nr:dihydropteroate synthase [Cytophagaceae bacterium]
MGILNLTPDSFYDGGKYHSVAKVLDQASFLYEEGALIVDLGAFSSRPGAEEVSEEEEWKRLQPVIKNIKKHYPHRFLSIDTYRSEIAYRSLEEGADIINDISGGNLDRKILRVATAHKAPYIAMHMRGTPGTMQSLTQYNRIAPDILDYFVEVNKQAREEGLSDLIVDPGFGFAKTVEQNYELLDQMEVLKPLQRLILVGLSRKSMIYKSLNQTSSESLNGTTALHMTALLKGADILRVHDVKEAIESITLYRKLRGR